MCHAAMSGKNGKSRRLSLAGDVMNADHVEILGALFLDFRSVFM